MPNTYGPGFNSNGGGVYASETPKHTLLACVFILPLDDSGMGRIRHRNLFLPPPIHPIGSYCSSSPTTIVGYSICALSSHELQPFSGLECHVWPIVVLTPRLPPVFPATLGDLRYYSLVSVIISCGHFNTHFHMRLGQWRVGWDRMGHCRSTRSGSELRPADRLFLLYQFCPEQRWIFRRSM